MMPSFSVLDAIGESNLATTSKLLFEIACMIRGAVLPALDQGSWVEPPGTLMTASEPFRDIEASPSGFTKLHSDAFKLLELKLSDTGVPTEDATGVALASFELPLSPAEFTALTT